MLKSDKRKNSGHDLTIYKYLHIYWQTDEDCGYLMLA